MSLPPEITSDARTTPTDSGVIHNIGYRSYDGPRLGRSYATRSLFIQSLRAAYGLGRSGKSKVLPMLMLAALAVPAVVIVSFAIMTQSDHLPLDYVQYLTSFGLFVQIFLASQAPVLMSRDLRFNTVPLYFSRPITRGDYVRAKFGAMAAAMVLLMVTPLVVLYVGSLLGGLSFGRNTSHFLYGLAAALLFAVLYSAIGLLIAAATPRRGFGVAAIMGVLTISGIVATIIYGLNGAASGTPSEAADWAFVLSPAGLTQGLVNHVFGLATDPFTPNAPGTVGVIVFAVEFAVVAVGSYWLLLRRYRKI